MSDQFDLFKQAQQARDAAFDQVMEHEEGFMSQLVNWVLRHRDWTGIGEELRIQALDAGVQQPHHHNVWGAAIYQMVRSGILKQTGVIRHMKTAKSHGRSSREYRVNATVEG